MDNKPEKSCFIITPIGNEGDSIRRHIEGIIDAAICPALEDKYELIVAHRIYEPGSITKQIISEIYNAELVIANLTNRNPNVMYELAFRHSLGKPVIMIAESGTNIPTDIIMERTIFYHNDAQGVLELRDALEKAESEIDFNKTGSPIHDVLHSILLDKNIIQLSQKESQTEQEVLPYILSKLNKIEDAILTNRAFKMFPYTEYSYRFSLFNLPEDIEETELVDKMRKSINAIPGVDVNDIKTDLTTKKFTINYFVSGEYPRPKLETLRQALYDSGIQVAGKAVLLRLSK